MQHRFKALEATTFGAWKTLNAPGGAAGWGFVGGFFAPGANGTYQFRARLKNVDTGHTSGWSPAAAITLR